MPVITHAEELLPQEKKSGNAFTDKHAPVCGDVRLKPMQWTVCVVRCAVCGVRCAVFTLLQCAECHAATVG
jgi:carbonic anhydrase/acetyltransferase-like protein (isoleucine patch superfamily)